jgi:type IV secretory pathway ATPase VirB11/archaellum biosynthesis ATPase
VAVVWFGADRIAEGTMKPGAMIAFLTYLTQILMSVMMTTWMAALIPRAAVSAERIMEVLETPSSIVIADNPITELSQTAVLQFDHVSFRYPGAEQPVLSDVSFTVRAGETLAIIGSTGSGKTTLLRALLNEVPREERIVTIEDAYELGIERFADLHPDHDALQSRAANIEGRGEVTMADLTRMALRMDPDRVIVGEVRGAEAFPMLMAMSQGNNGSMCTMHADGTKSVFPKLAAYVSMASTGLPVDTVNLLMGSAVHFVVFISLDKGVRRIRSVREVIDSDGVQIISNEIFRPSEFGGCETAYPLKESTRILLEE